MFILELSRLLIIMCLYLYMCILLEFIFQRIVIVMQVDVIIPYWRMEQGEVRRRDIRSETKLVRRRGIRSDIISYGGVGSYVECARCVAKCVIPKSSMSSNCFVVVKSPTMSNRHVDSVHIANDRLESSIHEQRRTRMLSNV